VINKIKSGYLKCLEFFDKNSNLILIGILIFALIIRLKYLTINQAVWYDEAEYLASAKAWAFGTPYELHFVRPVLLPFIFSIFYKLGGSELVFRTIILIFSITGIFFTYLIGKKLFDKWIALIATFILSFFYVHIFYTARLLTDLPSMTLWLISVWLFLNGYIESKSKFYLWVFGLFVILGILMKFPFGLIGLVILIYLFVTERFKFMKNKNLWIAVFIGILIFIPYGLWYYNSYNKLPLIGAAEFYSSVNYFKVYLLQIIPLVLQSPIPFIHDLFPKFGNFLIIFSIVGIIGSLFNLIVGHDLVKKDNRLKSYLFTLLWFIIPFIYFSYFAGQAPEDRYLFYSYPALFYLIGVVIVWIYNRMKMTNFWSGIITLIIVLLILISASVQNLKTADNIINAKASSYIQFRQSGEWIKENTGLSEKILAAGGPQLSYYSEREIVYWPSKKEDFERLLHEDKSIKYIILSRLEGSPEWSYTWPQENPDKIVPVQAYIDSEQRPMLIIYEVKR